MTGEHNVVEIGDGTVGGGEGCGTPRVTEKTNGQQGAGSKVREDVTGSGSYRELGNVKDADMGRRDRGTIGQANMNGLGGWDAIGTGTGDHDEVAGATCIGDEGGDWRGRRRGGDCGFMIN